MKDIFLRSGKWRWSVGETTGTHEILELIDPAAPFNKMEVRVPLPWEPSEEAIQELAREPEIRLWTDEYGIAWRIARVGPETHYPYPFSEPYLVFDSEETFAGIAPLEEHARLGELTDEELRLYRNGMRDFGGRRRAFRPPPPHH